MNLGHTAVTWMFALPSSASSERERSRTNRFAAEYTASFGWGMNAATLEMLMMREPARR